MSQGIWDRAKWIVVMSAIWDDDLVLLTKDELRVLHSELIVTSILGEQMRISELVIDELDLRYGVSAWGLPPETWEQVGKIVVKYVT